MRNRPRLLWVCTVLLVAPALAVAGAAEPKGVKGKVVAVTLYRGQAMVARTVPVAAPAGQVELLVADLPAQVVPESLFAEAGDGIEVRAVRHRTRAVGVEPREEVRKLDAQLETLEADIGRNKKMQELLQRKLAYLEKLESFTVPTAKLEMSKGVLNVETLKTITQFSFEQREKATTDSLKLEAEARDLAKKRELLKRQRSKLMSGSSRTAHEALVFLEKRAAAPGEIKLSYLVKGSGWTPTYNFRANADRTKVAVEYSAIIRQVSGEDWNGVALTLSTASPALSAEGPGLAPFRVALGRVPSKGKPRQADVVVRFRESQKRLRVAQIGQMKAQVLRDNRDANWLMNDAANTFQNYELVVEKDAFQTLRVASGGAAEGPSVSYKLAAPVSLASRTDQQMLRIDKMSLDSSFYYTATPILTSYVYREAKIRNTGAEVLLAGPVSVYLDGRFVGRGEMPTVARGEEFVMGFGADAQLRARRERVDRTERAQGGNREIAVQYRLTLENYKKEAATIRLFDRMPVSERDSDIRVALGELKDKLSADKLYVRLEKPKGILRWDIAVAAGAAGETARTLEYGYTLEFDRSLIVAAPGRASAPAMRQEFEQLQKGRYNK